MARIRTLKPEFPQSETIGKLSREARLLFVLLWTIVDDEGRARAASRMLASLLYPYDDDAPSLIDGWMGELERHGCVRRYEVDGSSYLDIPNWLKHQKIDRPSTSKLPPFPGVFASPREPSRSLDADLGPRTMDLGREEAASAASAGAAEKSSAPKRDRAWMEALEAKLRAAAGLESDPSPNLVVVGPIVGLIDAGADLEADILPVIRAKAKAGAKPRSWSFFTGAIQDAVKARHAAGEHIPKPPAPPDETPEQTRKRMGIPEPKDRPWAKWDRPVQTYFVSGGRDWPEWMLGPPPDHPGCCAPQDLIDSHRPRQHSAA